MNEEIKKKAINTTLALLSQNKIRKQAMVIYGKDDNLLPIIKEAELITNAIRWEINN